MVNYEEENFSNRFYILAAYVLYVVFYLALCLTEKVVFTAVHSHLTEGLSRWEVMRALFMGLRYDMPVAVSFALLSLPARLYFCREDRYRPGFFYLTTILLLLLIQIPHMGDVIYFTETQRHMSYEALELFADPQSIVATAAGRYTIHFFIQVPILLLFFKISQGFLSRQAKNSASVKVTSFQWILVLLFYVIGIRGGLQAVPMSPINANKTGSPQSAAIALNGVYNAFYAAFSSYDIEQIHSAPSPLGENQVAAFLKQSGIPRQTTTPKGAVQKYNIVLIFLESWDAYRIGSYGYEKNTTPYFDSLRKKSFTTREMLAGGLRTTEGVFSVLCSWPNPLGKTIPNTHLEQFSYRCLPQIFREQEYRLAFFQGTFQNTVNTGDFVTKLGFQESYGKENIKNEKYPRNYWGVHDHDLYDFIVSKIDETDKPFFFGVNTATTHDKVVPPGVTPFGEEPKENVLHFADDALRHFFEKASKKPWFKNTIFVLVADHTSFVPAENFQKYRIPFLIYAPGIVKPQMVETVATQRDIAPTLLSYFNMEIPAYFTGHNLTAPERIDRPRFADYYDQGTLGWVQDSLVVEIPIGAPEKAVCNRYPEILKSGGQPCSPEHEKLVRRALVFTEYSQTLLFQGQTNRFGEAFALPVSP